jgi:hypothetical protein
MTAKSSEGVRAIPPDGGGTMKSGPHSSGRSARNTLASRVPRTTA